MSERSGTLTLSDWFAARRPLITGVSLRLSQALGAHVLVVRTGFLVSTIAAGFGLVLYAAAWIWLPRTPDAAVRPASTRSDAGIAFLVAAALATATIAMPWLPAPLLWFVTMIAMGVAIAGATRADGPATDSMLRGARARALFGGLLIVVAVGFGLSALNSVANLWVVVIAVVVLLAGLAVVFSPWLSQLTSSAEHERDERIRAEERSDIASHLHDSVLQTLTLIQNRADDPKAVAMLAHQQERDLRTWLYRDGPIEQTAVTLQQALDQLAVEIETNYPVRVENLVSGDTPLGPRSHAALGATREALTNAARHSGAMDVSIFADIDSEVVAIFVRDRGCGFDVESVASDRHGLKESIISRMERIGGDVHIRSSPNSGTELTLRYVPDSAIAAPTPIDSAGAPS